MKRIMIAYDSGKPTLLVTTGSKNRNIFPFFVVNGAWNGRYKNGQIYCEGELIEGVYKILSEDQEKLKGDYNDVFERFR